MPKNENERTRCPNEDPYQYAHRMGRTAASNGGDWRDNPHLPGTREWFEFDDGLKEKAHARADD